ncbi:MAG: DUF4286 family protein [Breznakibacter sp.]|nr:DUF4286 family protein [Breznakibacter sp.]
MFLFNTTFSIDNSVINQWQSWMQKNYFASLADLLPLATYEIWEISLAQDNSDSLSLSCQWRCQTPDELSIINKYSTILLSNLSAELGEKCLYFSTILRKSDLL